MTHREQLFRNYYETHSRYLDDEAGKVAWFAQHLRQNYLPRMPGPQRGPRILEIGCARGFMLSALAGLGYTDLTGVDLSPADLDRARERVTGAELHCMDAVEFLHARHGAYDVIIAKAILEHQEKSAILPLLETLKHALRPGGRVLIEVPNMDWLMAAHERYMDFTHEVGFTRESLGQLLRLVYGNAAVHPVRDDGVGAARFVRPVLRTAAAGLVGLVLRALGNNAHETLWNARSILGVATLAPVERPA
ncbi:MAG TPA: class I SAM-dependent methyltransferase [Longimicrobiales bacterium]